MKQGPFAAPSEPSVFDCQQARYVWYGEMLRSMLLVGRVGLMAIQLSNRGLVAQLSVENVK